MKIFALSLKKFENFMLNSIIGRQNPKHYWLSLRELGNSIVGTILKNDLLSPTLVTLWHSPSAFGPLQE